ncbi:extracellular solute-binding protein [Flammeovirga pacifica]|uniref:ABC transporter substrate-binding protein n=1 Tax=Flammeovirga pacifica TaxID=915059 RepID=A0A1S1YZS0_FLAPC|nr:extracellular solute-binding protein [Flammeovirga pacifica]OHX66506.1 ABC transporter substrate-binding protein [Flammeovirga pacifica]
MKEKLRIAVRKFGPFESALQKIWSDFCSQRSCDVELEAVPLDLHPLYDTTLKNYGLKNGDWDIALMNTDWITEAFSTKSIIDLMPFIGNDPSVIETAWSPSLLGKQRFEKSVVGLPFHNGPECLMYRTDLFEDPKEKEVFKKKYNRELTVPSTWDELMEVATFFNRPSENLYGTTFAAYPDGHNTVFDFCLQLWTRGGQLITENNQVVLHSKATVDGMKFYRKALQNKDAIHPKSREFDSVEAGLAFANGELALSVNWFGFAANCEVNPDSKVKGKVDVAYIPAGQGGEGVSLNAYWMYVIGAGSKKQQLAYDFIQFATSVKNDELLTLEGGIGCRISTWRSPKVNEEIPYYHKLEELHQNTESLPRMNNWSQVADIIDELVLKVINTDETIESILSKAQIKVNQLQLVNN